MPSTFGVGSSRFTERSEQAIIKCGFLFHRVREVSRVNVTADCSETDFTT